MLKSDNRQGYIGIIYRGPHATLGHNSGTGNWDLGSGMWDR